MMRNCLLAATVFFFNNVLYAQEIVVEMGPSDKGRQLPTSSSNKGEYGDGVWTAFENFQLLKSPINNSAPSGYKPLIYMEHFDVAHEYQGEGENYFLLSKGKGEGFKIFGWIPTRFVSFHRAQINRFNISKKALIVNSLDILRSKGKVDAIPVRKAPTETANSIEPLRLYNIYSIFGDTEPKSPTEGYCLLGVDTGFDAIPEFKTNPAKPAGIVKGWVAKKNLCLWDTREALEWDSQSTAPILADKRRTEPVQVFKTREDALKVARGMKVEPWFTETLDTNGESIPMKYYNQRYPIIPMNKSEKIQHPDLGELYKIGTIGGFVDDQGNEIASKAQLEKLRQKLIDLENEMEWTDLVFIIDDTESMDLFFKAAAECVEKILEAVKKEKGKVRVGLAFYNDIPFGERTNPDNFEKAIEIHPLTDIAGPDGQKIIRLLKEHKTNRGGDPREQMFHGLTSALEKMNFERHRRKVAILIGDTGDHDTNQGGDFAKESKIVSRMVSEDRTPIEFFGIQVLPPKEDPDLLAFKSQVQKIIELSHAKMKSIETKDAQGNVIGTQMDGRKNLYVQISDVEEVITQILDRYKKLREQAEKTQEEIKSIRGGQWARVSPEVERILKQENVDLNLLRQTQGLQIFDYGWVWQKGKPQNCSCNQVRVKILAEEFDRLNLARILEDIENAGGGRTPTRDQIARTLIKGSTGENETGTLQENRLKALGLDSRSPLLGKALLEDGKEDFSFQKELEKIYHKRRLLEDIGRDQKSHYDFKEELDGNNQTVRVPIRKGEPKQELRMFRNPGSSKSTKWVWLDWEEEWP